MPRIQPKADSSQSINIFKTMDHSPNFLGAFQTFNGQVSKGSSLSEELREKIALTCAGKNSCDYCVAAHTHLAKKAGISDGGIEFALQGKCGDPKINAALEFVTALIEKRGHIDDADFQNVKDAGYSDQEIIDIFGQTMANMITNYFNDFVQTDVDF
jgi:AhpD family alkylhydroperoxidase